MLLLNQDAKQSTAMNMTELELFFNGKEPILVELWISEGWSSDRCNARKNGEKLENHASKKTSPWRRQHL
jgi:hypothetical protein